MECGFCGWTDSNTGDVGVPDLCGELHDGRLEGIVVRDFNVDMVSSAVVGSVWRAAEDTLEMCQVIESVGAGLSLVQRLERDTRVAIFLHVLDFFDQAAISVCRHDSETRPLWTKEKCRVISPVVIVRVRGRVVGRFEEVI